MLDMTPFLNGKNIFIMYFVFHVKVEMFLFSFLYCFLLESRVVVMGLIE